MSKAFKNQIATIAALDGFINMMFDIIIKDCEERGGDEEVNRVTPLKDSLVKIKHLSRAAQKTCMGMITQKEYKLIEKEIRNSAALFVRGGDDSIMNVVGYMSFSLIGMDNVIQKLKGVKKKLRNNTKITAFETLAGEAFKLIQMFDPELNSINEYEQAAYARQRWEIIFEL